MLLNNGWKKIPSEWILFLCIALSLCCNILLTVRYLGVGVEDKTGIPSRTIKSYNDIDSPTVSRTRMAREKPSIGYIHVGKTGGTTISKLLRNGCHSFFPKPCRVVANETVVSKLVEHYYHVPDFHTLPTSGDESYILSVRDVYDRTVSAFLYSHPKNVIHYGNEHNMRQSSMVKERDAVSYKCFPTLETFASLLLRGSSTDCDYPYLHNAIVTNDCSELACAVSLFPSNRMDERRNDENKNGAGQDRRARIRFMHSLK